MADDHSADPPLIQAGPPFQVGETVAFFPAVLGPTSMWLQWDYAVIEDIDEDAESFGFHFVNEPGVRHGQGMENAVRYSRTYEAWRSAWEAAFGRTQDESLADRETEQLRLRLIAEHPIHGRRHTGP